MSGDGRFLTTRWSVVLRAGAAGDPARDAPEARAALEHLAAAYWPPLCAFARRMGYDREAALDLTQGFFALLLERRDVAAARPERGRFRAYLLTAFRRFLVNEAERERALKRGGGRAPHSLGSGPDPADPAHGETPERAFDRAWALALLERALEAVRAEYAERGKERLFEALKPHLAGGDGATPYAALARALGATEGGLKVAAHRLRARYRDRLRREVADTVSDPREVEAELRDLFAALAGGNAESP